MSTANISDSLANDTLQTHGIAPSLIYKILQICLHVIYISMKYMHSIHIFPLRTIEEIEMNGNEHAYG